MTGEPSVAGKLATGAKPSPGADLPSALRLALRSLLIQGSWNYRTFQGAGVAWALHRGSDGGRPSSTPAIDPGVEADLVANRAGLFNAHPYLAPIALGAFARAEADGVDRERLRRLREGLGTPLGSLGDRLVWGAWRPLCLLGAILAGVLGAPPLAAVIGFLVIYNSVHLVLRVRGAAIGLRTGIGVASGIRELDLARWAERAASLGVLLLGVALGAGIVWTTELPGGGIPVAVGAVAALLVGFVRGESLGRAGGWALLVVVTMAIVFGSATAGSGGG